MQRGILLFFYFSFIHFGSLVSGEKETGEIVPYKIHVSEEILEDLQIRLKNARLPPPSTEILIDSLPDDSYAEKKAKYTIRDEIRYLDRWSYGTDPRYLRELVEYWREKFDWRAQEAKLNEFDQFMTEIDGMKVHFIHMKASRVKYPRARGLLMSHGWPGSILECTKVIPLLTDPLSHFTEEDVGREEVEAFDVICPSLPGYGWSDAPKVLSSSCSTLHFQLNSFLFCSHSCSSVFFLTHSHTLLSFFTSQERGWNPAKIATLFSKLMARLGYNEYIAQGGDWGSIISTQLGILDTKHCLGIHITLFPVNAPYRKGFFPLVKTLLTLARPSWFLSEAETTAIQEDMSFWLAETGYMILQATKPQTISYALSDSPVGLAAYFTEVTTDSLHHSFFVTFLTNSRIFTRSFSHSYTLILTPVSLQKFRTWSDCNGTVETRFTKDELLTNIMIYWVTGSISSSMRLYYEMFHTENFITEASNLWVPTPTGGSIFPKVSKESDLFLHFLFLFPFPFLSLSPSLLPFLTSFIICRKSTDHQRIGFPIITI
jgi:hypothetical protein